MLRGSGLWHGRADADSRKIRALRSVCSAEQGSFSQPREKWPVIASWDGAHFKAIFSDGRRWFFCVVFLSEKWNLCYGVFRSAQITSQCCSSKGKNLEMPWVLGSHNN
jgi:hypothetical protein